MKNSLGTSKRFLGKRVKLIIDRPLGSKHPKYGFVYEVNYGYIKGVKSPDGEDLDAYYLGVDKPVKRAKGICIATVHRVDDDDDKLIIVPKDKINTTDDEIEKAINFQEKWFKHIIVRQL
jgi:inorganic pyrophosphatase